MSAPQGSDFATLGIRVRLDGPTEQRMPCPRCDRGARDDALGVNIESGTFHCFRCGWAGRASTGETRAASVIRLDDPDRAARVRRRLHEVWAASVPLGHPASRPVEHYLCSRGLEVFLAHRELVLHAHPALAYSDTATRREIGRFPAMLARLTGPQGELVSVHATYLRQDGSAKAPVPNPKKVLGVPIRGATKGSAIALLPPTGDGRLGVAEGIENALSLALLRRIPTWASYCCGNLERMALPPTLRELKIAVDVDASGQGKAAACALARRAARLHPNAKVTLVMPESGFKDLNDELRAAAAKARAG